MASLEQKLDVLESQLYSFLFNNIVENQSLDKFFLVPIGLPGMGKSTLSRFLSETSQTYFNEKINRKLGT